MSSYKTKSFEDKKILNDIEKIISKKRKQAFVMPKEGEHVILLTSGGTDSLLLWGMLLDVYKLHVHPLYITEYERDTGPQIRAIKEFSLIYKSRFPAYFHKLTIKRHVWHFSFRDTIRKRKNLLTAEFIDSNMTYYLGDNPRVVITNQPTRIASFLFAAYELALTLRFVHAVPVSTIILGLVADDSFLTRESTLTTLRALNLGAIQLLNDRQLQFTAPLEKDTDFYYTKKDLYTYAFHKHLPLEKTWSCNFSGRRQCGKCTSCVYRKRVFQQLGLQDKTKYGETEQIKTVRHIVGKVLGEFDFRRNTLIQKLTSLQVKTRAPIHYDTKIVLSPTVSWTKNRQGIAIFNQKTMLFEYLNSSASFLWEKLAESPLSINEMSLLIAKRYKISKSSARQDVRAMCETYLKSGIFTASQSSPQSATS